MTTRRQIMVQTAFGRLGAAYDGVTLPLTTWSWVAESLRQMANVYAVSAIKPLSASLVDTAPALVTLLRRYLEVCAPGRTRLHERRGAQDLSHPLAPLPSLDPDRSIVFFTSGKDSTHLLLRLKEEGRAKDGALLAVYCTNLNRSETIYEQASTKEICAKLGIPLRTVRVTNGIKLNREAHNIGLREQLVAFLALPHILEHRASTLFYGLHGTSEHLAPALWTSDFEAFGLFLEFFKGWGLAVSKHVDFPNVDEERIIADLCARAPDLLRESTSCYTQPNFREQHHKLLSAKLPGIPLYKGCGNCLKCCRINAGMLLYAQERATWPEGPKRNLVAHLTKRFNEKFRDDHTLESMVNQLKEQKNAPVQ